MSISIGTQNVPQLVLINLDWLTTVIFFPNSVSSATVRIQTNNIHPVVVQARQNVAYLVPNTLLIPRYVNL